MHFAEAVDSAFASAEESHRRGELAEALAGYRRVLVLAPQHGMAWTRLGILMASRKVWAPAHRCFRRAVGFPDSRFEALEHMARAFVGQGEIRAAGALGLQMIIERPDEPIGYLFHQTLQASLDRLDVSRRLLEHANALAPDDVEVLGLLANVLLKQGLMTEAMAKAEEQESKAPDLSAPHLLMAEALARHGRIDDAFQKFRRVAALDPFDARVMQSCLYHANFLDGTDTDDLLGQHKIWSSMHVAPYDVPDRTYPQTAEPERRLRIAFVSADMYFHSVAYFLAPLLERLDREKVDVACYSSTDKSDDNTRRLQGLCDLWRDVRSLDDDQLAELILRDGVDVLVDLSGHTHGERLRTFARRPAPVQISWLGYPNTTGVKAIPYRLTDAVADPPGLTDAHYSERLVRLQRPFLCYQAPDMPEPGPPPCLRNGYVTFGSFNNIAKVTARVLDTWIDILRAVPDSRLVLKNRCFNDDATRDYFRGRLRDGGVDPDRLILHTFLPREQHFTIYDTVDVALDPFPYNGTTTTCEALWMGVPVVALTGRTHRSRVGTMLLRAIGLDDLAADDLAGYVETAVTLSADRDRLSALRTDLRRRVGESPLCDAEDFAAAFESAVRGLWRDWCATATRSSAL